MITTIEHPLLPRFGQFGVASTTERQSRTHVRVGHLRNTDLDAIGPGTPVLTHTGSASFDDVPNTLRNKTFRTMRIEISMTRALASK
jgi:hypothetical protein